jgi:hypothetical protein
MPDGKPKQILIQGGLAIAVLAAILLLRRPVPEDNRVHWSDMLWDKILAGGRAAQHAALMVETEFEGSRTRGVMQLDLGIYRSVLYRPAAGTLNSVPLSGTIAHRHFRNEKFPSYPYPAAPVPATKPILLGTIGTGFFEHRILILDFVAQRLAILGKNAVLPPALDRGIEYLPLRFQDGHVLVAAAIDGRQVLDAMYDTGASMFPLVTSRATWLEWTHRQPEDPLNSTLRVNSWGREAVLVGAPVGTLCIGTACLSRPEIYFASSGIPAFDQDEHPQLPAAFGNAIFDARYTVIVDIPGRRLGLVHGSFDASGD